MCFLFWLSCFGSSVSIRGFFKASISWLRRSVYSLFRECCDCVWEILIAAAALPLSGRSDICLVSAWAFTDGLSQAAEMPWPCVLSNLGLYPGHFEYAETLGLVLIMGRMLIHRLWLLPVSLSFHCLCSPQCGAASRAPRARPGPGSTLSSGLVRWPVRAKAPGAQLQADPRFVNSISGHFS